MIGAACQSFCIVVQLGNGDVEGACARLPDDLDQTLHANPARTELSEEVAQAFIAPQVCRSRVRPAGQRGGRLQEVRRRARRLERLRGIEHVLIPARPS